MASLFADKSKWTQKLLLHLWWYSKIVLKSIELHLLDFIFQQLLLVDVKHIQFIIDFILQIMVLYAINWTKYVMHL